MEMQFLNEVCKNIDMASTDSQTLERFAYC
uniref:Uncharacterized protein n=1 Tax=Anguilla anguilla TaxID=7936 RepID=A0A0E9T6Z9_ANGAN